MSESATVGFARPITVAAGVYAPGHLGELTQYLPFELVDDVLDQTRTVQRGCAICRRGSGCTSCSRWGCSRAWAMRGCGRS